MPNCMSHFKIVLGISFAYFFQIQNTLVTVSKPFKSSSENVTKPWIIIQIFTRSESFLRMIVSKWLPDCTAPKSTRAVKTTVMFTILLTLFTKPVFIAFNVLTSNRFFIRWYHHFIKYPKVFQLHQLLW